MLVKGQLFTLWRPYFCSFKVHGKLCYHGIFEKKKKKTSSRKTTVIGSVLKELPLHYF